MADPRSRAAGATPQPGGLRSQVSFRIQTRQAQRLIYGRRAEPEKGIQAIVGLVRFGAMLGPLWAAAGADDPYADWWLLHVERELNAAHEAVESLRQAVSDRLASRPAFLVQVAVSLEPVEVPLQFANPYAFLGAELLSGFDDLVREVLTARHVALLDRERSEKLLHEGGRAVRRAYAAASGFRLLGVSREDVRGGTAKALRALETFEVPLRTMGPLPQEVIDASLRAAHAPAIRPRGERLAPVAPEPDPLDFPLDDLDDRGSRGHPEPDPLFGDEP